MFQLSEEIKLFLISMTPIGELRVSIPIGIAVYKLNPVLVYFVSVLGNIFAVLLVLVSLGVISNFLSKRFYFFNRFFAWLFSKTRNDHALKIEKYGIYALPIFVAVPLPFTGGWTGALIAFVFGMPFWTSFPLISLGILIAGLLVLLISQAGVTLNTYFGWQVLIGLLIIFLVGLFIYKKMKLRELTPVVSSPLSKEDKNNNQYES